MGVRENAEGRTVRVRREATHDWYWSRASLNHHSSWGTPPRTRFSTNHGAVPAGGQRPPRANPDPAGEALALGQRCVTPRQACPRPNGFGRNLRSKTRWFTGFCNSHQVSHFATFFIDARAEISVAESRFGSRAA